MSKEPKTNRRCYQFSLRTMLVFVTIASASFGWLGMKLRQAQRQKEAAEAIEELGGMVLYDYHYDSNGKLINPPVLPGPVWLRKLTGDKLFANVVGVSLRDREVTDSDLISLQIFPRLKFLEFTGTHLHDAELVHLQRLGELKGLEIYDEAVTDAGLVHLEGLMKLEKLYILGTKVTYEGEQKLRKARPNLEILR